VASQQLSGALRASGAYLLVGTLASVSASLPRYPVFGAQALRYALATLVLVAADQLHRRHKAHAARSEPARPEAAQRLTVREVGRLVLIAAMGLAGFNFCVTEAVRRTGPTALGTVIAAVPVVLAILAPLARSQPAGRHRPTPRVMGAAVLVAAGAGIATGLGAPSATGLLFALGALAGEVAFTLLAVPLLPKLGPIRLSAYVSALATPMLLGAGLIANGKGAVPLPSPKEAAAICYLAVAVSAGGFFLIYSALPRLGADRAGLFAGLVPFGAMGSAILLGTGTARPADLAGAALVAAGVVTGTASKRPASKRNGIRRHRSSAKHGRGRRVASEPFADGGTAWCGAAVHSEAIQLRPGVSISSHNVNYD
jgi:drug/metabolite transporter (DMT)-like permease